MVRKILLFPISARDIFIWNLYTGYTDAGYFCRRREEPLTREENLIYRRNCPYDAMGDYSLLIDENRSREKSMEKSEGCTESGKDPIRQYR